MSGPPAKKFAPPPIAVEIAEVGNAGAPYCTTVKLLVVNQPGIASTSLPEPLPGPASASPLIIDLFRETLGQRKREMSQKQEVRLPITRPTLVFSTIDTFRRPLF